MEWKDKSHRLHFDRRELEAIDDQSAREREIEDRMSSSSELGAIG